MLAARLCFAWGIEDVNGWMDNVSPTVLDFWEAFDAIEPIGEQWRQTATVTTMAARIVEYTAAVAGHKMDPTLVDDAMPARYRPYKRQAIKSQPQDQQTDFNRLASALGLGKVVAKHGRINQPS